MTTFTLLVFLAYSGGDMGPLALDSVRVDFFSEAQCEAAAKRIRSTLKDEFRRFVVVCVDRTMPTEGGPFPENGKKG